MSESPHEYHLNFGAANELEKQSDLAKRILVRLAAHLAAFDPRQPSDLKEVVTQEHVRRAADVLFNQLGQPTSSLITSANDLFISYSHADEQFIKELADKLNIVGITTFIADRDIRPATDWADALLNAIRCCRTFVTVLTPRFMSSRWLDFEGGAAIASRKPVLVVLRYVDRNDVPVPLSRFQMMVVESERQLDVLISTLRNMCKSDLESE